MARLGRFALLAGSTAAEAFKGLCSSVSRSSCAYQAAGHAHRLGPRGAWSAPWLPAGVPGGGVAAYATAPAASSSAIQGSVSSLLSKITESEGCSRDNISALKDFFTAFDGEAVLVQTGVLSELHPRSKTVLQALSGIFCEQCGGARQFSLEQCANILSTVTLLGYTDIKLNHCVLQQCRDGMPGAEPHTLASLCYSLGISGYSDFAFLHGMETLLTQRQQEFDLQELAKCVWMFGRARFTSDKVVRLVQAVVSRATKPDTSFPDMVYALWSCEANGEHNEDLLAGVVEAAPGQLGTLTGGELAKLAHALMMEGVRDERLFQAIGEYASKVLEEMFPRDIAKLAHAVGTVQVADAALLSALEKSVLHHLERFTGSELDQLMRAYNSLGVHDSVSVKVAERMHHVTKKPYV